MLIFFLGLFCSLQILAAPLVNANSAICDGKQVMGRIEKVKLPEKNLIVDAKLDTGASMTSLSTAAIKIFEVNNKPWVRFIVYLPATQKKIYFTAPLVRYVHILKRSEEIKKETAAKKYSLRPVVRLSVCLGGKERNILVNLVDRSQFRYPLLLGKNALEDFKLLVDVSHDYMSSSDCESRK